MSLQKRIAALLLAACFVMLAGTPCAAAEAATSSLDQFNDPNVYIYVPTGSMAMTATEERFPDATIVYPASELEGYTAVATGRADAFAHDDLTLCYAAATNKELAVYPETFGGIEIAIGISKHRKDLKPLIDDVLTEMQADGSLTAMMDRWATNTATLPAYTPPENPAGTLRVGTSGLTAPMTYYGEGGQITGSDIELTYALGAKLNLAVEIQVMPYDALVLALQSGGLDVVIANLNVTPERAKLIDYSIPYRIASTALLIRAGGPYDQTGKKKDDPLGTMQGVQEYVNNGKRIAVVTGSVFDTVADELFPGAEKVYVPSQDAAANEVLTGKADCYMADRPQASVAVALQPKLWLSPLVVKDDAYGVVFRMDEEALCDQFSQWLGKQETNGSLAALQDKWLNGNPDTVQLDQAYAFTGENGTLDLGLKTDGVPFSYLRGGDPMGYEYELICKFCIENGYALNVTNADLSALLLGMSGGKLDMAAGCISITDERKERMRFSDATYAGGMAIVFSAETHNLLAGGGEAEPLSTLEQLQSFLGDGSQIGILVGSAPQEEIAARYFPNAKVEYMSSMDVTIASLNSGKIDAYLNDLPIAIAIQAEQPDQWYSSVHLNEEQYGIGFRQGLDGVRDEFSTWLNAYKTSGAMATLQAKWTQPDISGVKMDEYTYTGEKGTLTISCYIESIPFVYILDGKPAGYEVELFSRFCQECGYTPVWQPCSFDAMLASVATGKTDIAIGTITITAERAKNMHFSAPEYSYPVVLVVRRADYEALLPSAANAAGDGATSLWQSIAASFESTFIREDRWQMIAQGLLNTVLISVLSAIFGTAIGFLLCMARRSSKRPLSAFARIFVRIVQGTPIVVLLMILYYLVFGDVEAIFVAVVGFSVNFGAYVSEMMRTGIDAVDPGQREAAAALGFTRSQAFLRIVFPQAARHFLPVYRGEFISMVKMTSIVGYITIQDLTRMSDIIRSRTYEAFFPLITTAILYFLLAWLLTLALGALEKRLDPARKQKLERRRADHA